MSSSDFDRLRKMSKTKEFSGWDLWDTLITRCVLEPQELFEIVGETVGIPNFRELRVRAEKNLRAEEIADEITMLGIYSKLDLDEALKQMAYEAELRFELEMSVPIFENIDQVRWGDIIVTDMYLPRPTIEELVKIHNIQVRPADIYISSELGASKRSGKLFDYIIGIGKKPRRFTGDNWSSDVKQCRKRGIAAFHYVPAHSPSGKARSRPESKQTRRIVGAVKAARLGRPKEHNDTSHLWDVAATVVAPVVLCKLIELDALATRIGATQVFFLSRDGYIIHRAFETYFPNRLVQTAYIYASRQALLLASSQGSPTSASSWMLKKSTSLSIEEVSGRANIDCDVLLNILRTRFDLHLSAHQDLDDDQISIVRQALSVEPFASMFASEARKAQVSCSKYYQSIGLFSNSSTEPAIIVDIGWHGSLQRALRSLAKASGSERPIHGFYLGLSEAARDDISEEGMHALVDEIQLTRSDFRPSRYASLIEALFPAPHPSLHRFDLSATGEIHPRFGNEIDIVSERSARCIDACVQQFLHFARINNACADKGYAMQQLSDFCSNPSREQVKAIIGLSHFDGQTHRTSRPFVLPHLVAVIRSVLKNGWRDGFGVWREGTWQLMGLGHALRVWRSVTRKQFG